MHDLPDFEIQDLKGRTKQFVGSVGTTPVLIPGVPEGRISELLIMCDIDNSNSARLKIDFTLQGAYGFTLNKGAYISWSLKGSPSIGSPIEQIRIVGNQPNISYSIICNFES